MTVFKGATFKDEMEDSMHYLDQFEFGNESFSIKDVYQHYYS